MVEFYGCFNKNFALIMSPFIKLLKKKKVFEWIEKKFEWTKKCHATMWAVPTQPCAVVSIFKSYIRVIGVG